MVSTEAIYTLLYTIQCIFVCNVHCYVMPNQANNFLYSKLTNKTFYIFGLLFLDFMITAEDKQSPIQLFVTADTK